MPEKSDVRKVEVVSRERRYGEYVKVDRYHIRHDLFAGGMSGVIQRDLVERGHAVGVLPYDPDCDEVVLLEQFRIGPFATGAHPWLIEIVAGIIEKGEEPTEVARREALEEAGVELGDLRFIGDFYASPGIMSEHVSIYLGKVDARKAGGIHGLDAEGEDIRVFTVSGDEAVRLVRDGAVKSPPALFALQWFALNRDALRHP